MNCVSAGECGGSFARVDEGSVFVGCPGAPGWTTTGLRGACCAVTDSDKRQARVPAGTSLAASWKHFIGLNRATRALPYHKAAREARAPKTHFLLSVFLLIAEHALFW